MFYFRYGDDPVARLYLNGWQISAQADVSFEYEMMINDEFLAVGSIQSDGALELYHRCFLDL